MREYDEKTSALLLAASAAFLSISVDEYTLALSPDHLVSAAASPTSSSLSSKMIIDFSDSSESEIHSYYSSLNFLSADEWSGTNLIKNLKPILQNMRYCSYSACWKIYEITDRDWSLSPASDDDGIRSCRSHTPSPFSPWLLLSYWFGCFPHREKRQKGQEPKAA